MASQRKPTNPFYIVLLIAGVIFLVTACSYFVMTIKGREVSLGRPEDPSSKRFVEIVDRYGFAALMIELGILAGATCAAIGTDEYWTRRVELEARQRPDEDGDESGER
ncbi:MAG: hypothetical protein O3C40_21850 [Planctomycetota bacterium]|nr:hypothetical protein [Planctomycetota bacterium]